jgi:glutamine phosphoribosylpyrophosphate amidotransferase
MDNGQPHVFKRAVTPSYFLRNCNHRLERAARFTTGFGHTRYGTHGANVDANAHPFTHRGIVFCHNGTIHNYHEILPSAVVDSECLGPLIEHRELEAADGSVAAVWLENGQLYAYRRNQNLGVVTLTYADGAQVTIVTTRPHLVYNYLPNGIIYAQKGHLHEGRVYVVKNSGLEAESAMITEDDTAERLELLNENEDNEASCPSENYRGG